MESDLISDKNVENKQKRTSENPNKSTYKYDEPVTIVGTFGIKEFETETNQRTIQMAPSEEHINYLKSHNAYGKRIQVTGSFFHSHTGHHFTPVLISVSEVKILN